MTSQDTQKAEIAANSGAPVLSGLPAIRRYIAMRDEKPIRMLGDDIHGIHAGSEFEASLCVQDLRAAVDNHDALVRALELARSRIEYLGSFGADRHARHNEQYIFPAIDAALNSVAESSSDAISPSAILSEPTLAGEK